MIARVTLDLALGKEFDYLIPAEMAAQVEVGTRVKVPFAHRQVLGCVTALLETSPHPNLRPLLKVIGRQSHVSPTILRLARWMGEYYCCGPEAALRTVLPEAVRKEKEGWREQLFVRALPRPDAAPKLSRRQEEILEFARAPRGGAVAGIVARQPAPPAKPCAAWRTRGCSPSRPKSPSATLTRAKPSCPRGRWR